LAVQQQIRDAEHFLQIIRTKHTHDEMRPNFKAFLSIARGISDYILEGYNISFGLNIVLTEKLKSETFRKEAKNKNNLAAVKFIDFFDYEFKNLRNESVVKLLFEKRNITIHRTDPALRGEFVANITEEIRIAENVNYIISDEDGNIKQ
jgi:hypothetical protein